MIKQKKSSSLFNFFQDSFNYFMIVLITILIIVIVVQMVVNAKPSSNLEADVFVSNLLYSTNGISYIDPNTGELLPIIDSSKLDYVGKEEISYLDDNFKYGTFNSYIAAKIDLINYEGNLFKQEIYNKHSSIGQYNYGYDVWANLDSKLFGGASSTIYYYEFPVSYIEDNEIKKGTLKIEVVLPYD